MSPKLKQYELLAPAGNLQKAQYALEFGADAIYAGVPDFSLRSRLKGFNDQTIIQAIKLAHQYQKKIYLTANIFAHNHHIQKLASHLKIYRNSPPDAFIVSDIGVMEIIKKYCPQVDIHLSTQANTTNEAAVKFWQRYGVTRIVLARELSLTEIQAIHNAVPKMELEYFVHGAMCMAYSGRCLLSAWQVPGRSSNLGDCAQNCRWKYSLMEETRPGEYIPVEQDHLGTYLLNSKDLCLIEYLEELKQAGVTSFKIEGRAKSVAYVAQVVKSYRQAMDIQPNDSQKKIKINKIKKGLQDIIHRGYTTGFLFGECRYKGQTTSQSHCKEKYEFVGEVIEYNNSTGLTKIKVHNALYLKDKIHILTPKLENQTGSVLEIYDDQTLEKLESAHGGQDREVYIKLKKNLPQFSILRRKI